MGLTDADPTPATPEDVLGLPAEPGIDQGETKRALSDAKDVVKLTSEALKAMDSEDYDTARSLLQDIDTNASNTLSAMEEMEKGIDAYDDWGNAWKSEALGRETDVLELLVKDWKHCLDEVANIQADESLTSSKADAECKIVIANWGVSNPELAAMILAVGTCRAELVELPDRHDDPAVQPKESAINKIRKITGSQRRAVF